MKFTIIADSGCDLKSTNFVSDKIDFSAVPLTITIGDNHYLDEENLDTKELVLNMKANKDAPKTACPPPEAFAEVMRKGDNIVCVTLSSKLSGTYNSARLAAETVLEESPHKKIFVLDSLTATAGMALILNKLKELIETGKYTFDEIIKHILSFRKSMKTRFLIHDYTNLIKTGRIGKLAGLIASIFAIKPICGDNGEGEIKMYAKILGTKKALMTLSDYPAEKIKEQGKDIPLVISHCHNEEDASLLKKLLESKFGLTNIKTYLMRGLASFYACDKGLVIAY
ncbi:MAG: DegV family protein [Christensenellaceae bacterium]|jgi:DegV family protein with EDD domain|nr:DegV family protein [Christensenellaceae bacterium]